jgi:hypothetical protein
VAPSTALVHRLAPALVVLTSACCAQDWQIGGGGGYGFYRKATVFAPAGQVDAGIRSRFVLTAWITDDRYDYVSGEFRYTYQDGDPFLERGAQQFNLQGQSHSFEYDVLFHFRDFYKRVRPYVTVGAGVKRYLVSGPPNPSQPFAEIASLNDTHETKFLGVAGVGLSLRIGANVKLRFDFRDYITKFPKQLIAPAPLGTGRGLFHQFTPMIGVAYGFGSP